MVTTKHSPTSNGRLWAVRVSVSESLFAASLLRPLARVEVLSLAEETWFRGSSDDESVQQTLRAIPALDYFSRTPEERLTRWNETVPCGVLPEGQWLAVTRWLVLTVPVAKLSGRVEDHQPLRLVRTEHTMDSNLLMTTWQAWHNYATAAPLVRLSPLSFAVADRTCVLIRGTPLPPIPGRNWTVNGNVAIPAGFAVEFGLDSATLRRILRLDADQLALIHEDGAVEVVEESGFVRATRSAVRLTERDLSRVVQEGEGPAP